MNETMKKIFFIVFIVFIVFIGFVGLLGYWVIIGLLSYCFCYLITVGAFF
jgi:hypothetical protein